MKWVENACYRVSNIRVNINFFLTAVPCHGNYHLHFTDEENKFYKLPRKVAFKSKSNYFNFISSSGGDGGFNEIKGVSFYYC